MCKPPWQIVSTIYILLPHFSLAESKRLLPVYFFYRLFNVIYLRANVDLYRSETSNSRNCNNNINSQGLSRTWALKWVKK